MFLESRTILGRNLFHQLSLLRQHITVLVDVVETKIFLVVGWVADQALDIGMVNTKHLVFSRFVRASHQVDHPPDRADTLSVHKRRLPVAEDHQVAAGCGVKRLGSSTRGNGDFSQSSQVISALFNRTQQGGHHDQNRDHTGQNRNQSGGKGHRLALSTNRMSITPKCTISPSETSAQAIYGTNQLGLRTTCKTVVVSPTYPL